MLTIGIALALFGVAAMAAALWLYSSESRRLVQRRKTEQQAAKAALEYLTQFGVRCATAAIGVGDGKLVILIETEPQKKLRFSYIIEQPLRDYVNKVTGLNVRSVYWRFPVAQKQQVPEVRYPASDTITMVDNRDVLPAEPAVVAAAEGESGGDDYFQEHAYQIEEVGWENFDTSGAAEADPKSNVG